MIDEITSSNNHADIRAKGLGILSRTKSLECISALKMLDPILCLILKTSSYLQPLDMSLFAALQLVKL